MIAFLEGKLAQKEPTHAIISANGVGYLVKISLQTHAQLPDVGAPNVFLHTVLIVREDSHTLFGFHSADEQMLFEDLISVSGIGPSIALVMLSSLTSAEIKQAIVQEDVATIQRIKGIGAKTAQRTIIELKDKLKKENWLGTAAPTPLGGTSGKTRQEALSALVTLGIPKATAEKSLDTILKKLTHEATVEELIKLALR